MTPEELRIYRRAYSKGYNTGRSNTWPEHMPPLPLDSPLVAELMRSARKARDIIDTILAMDEPEGEWEKKYGYAIDAVDAAMQAITENLKKGVSCSS